MSKSKSRKEKKSKVLHIHANPKDHVVTSFGGKPMFARVVKNNGKSYDIVPAIQKSDRSCLTIFPEDITANFGQKPARSNGKVLGVDTKHYAGSINYEFFGGTLHFVADVPKVVKKEVEKVLPKFEKLIKRHGFEGVFPMNFEFDNLPKSKTAGMYYKNKDDYDKIWFNVFHADLLATFCHEIGHAIWERLITKNSTKIKWVQLYLSHIKVEVFDKKEYKKMRDDFLSSAQTVASFSKSIEDEDKRDIFKKTIRQLCSLNNLRTSEINLINTSPEAQTLKDLWPPFPLILVRIAENNISQYAQKETVEYFCECVRLYLTKHTLPKRVRKLVEKTLQESATSKRRVLEETEDD